MRSKRTIVILLALSVVLVSACQRRPAQVDAKMNPQFTVAVAPFTVPGEPWDLLSGYLPERVSKPGPEALDSLDDILVKAMKIAPERNIIAGSKVESCVKGVRRAPDANRLATLKYWQEVGKCLDVQYLLVPMAVHWKDREGSAAGSTSPAWVILDIYLVNVKTGGLVNHFHYDYQQKALTDNILEADKFFKRRGQWVTASDLAREGIEKGLKEFGL
ncbi:MAG: hypothetical protein ACOZEN_10795 [Thermodesulfobacteriota bacterium]